MKTLKTFSNRNENYGKGCAASALRVAVVSWQSQRPLRTNEAPRSGNWLVFNFTFNEFEF